LPKKLENIHCPVCRDPIFAADVIVIDFMNTMFHHKCYDGPGANIQQIGSYKEIAKQFPFFYKNATTDKEDDAPFSAKGSKNDDYLSMEVKRIVNDVGDEIELQVIEYPDHYYVAATICQDAPPFKDYIGVGRDFQCVREAARKALKELYLQAYSNRY
jgi:hypothetical protein